MVEGICSGCSISCAVPCVFIAGCHIVCCVIMLTNVEVEGVRARAIIVVCIVECVSTTLGIVDFVPSELFTGILKV